MIRCLYTLIILFLIYVNLFCEGYEQGHRDGYVTAIADVVLGYVNPDTFFRRIK